MSFIFNIMLSLLWGGIISVVLIVLLYVLMSVLFSSYRFTLWNIIVMLILWILLFAQSTMMVGAMYAKGYVDDVQKLVTDVIGYTNADFGIYSSEEQLEKIKEAVDENLPVASSFVENIDVESITESGLNFADSVSIVMKSYINFYILRRVLWILGFMIVGGIALASMRPKPLYIPSADMNYYN